mmetsp:Transcript_38435/g.119607  ORF Transcript_38435/g.119607 Transcript_38435/m.119607 type:complete len:216 (+) Transcript_38435:575-1222(+)
MTSCWVGASSTRTKWDCRGGRVARSTGSKGSPASEKYLGPQISYRSTGLCGSWVSGRRQETSYFRVPEAASRSRGGPAASGSAGTSAHCSCVRRRSSSRAMCTKFSASCPACRISSHRPCNLSGWRRRTKRFHALVIASSPLPGSTSRSSSGLPAFKILGISQAASAFGRGASSVFRGGTGGGRGVSFAFPPSAGAPVGDGPVLLFASAAVSARA